MNELVNATPLTMSTLEIAGLTGKRHDNVLRDADKMLAELKITALKIEGCYQGENGKALRVLSLPKRECLILVSGYSVELRARIIDRWMELEGAIANASSDAVTVEGLSAEVRKIVGGIVKAVVHHEIGAIIPALVAKAVAETQVAVVHGVTAGEVITLAGVKERKGLRGLARIVSDRLRNFCARKGAVVNLGELGASTAYVFDPRVVREWLSEGGKDEILKRVAEKRGQGVLKLVPTESKKPS